MSFEKDVDTENNYYNNILISCRYYAEFNSDLNVNYNGGISLLHFNARSLRIAIMKYKIFFDLLR